MKDTIKFKLNSKVWIKQQKLDGSYEKGKVVGIDSLYPYLTHITERDYLNGFKAYNYKVAYICLATGKGRTEWFLADKLSKTKPE